MMVQVMVLKIPRLTPKEGNLLRNRGKENTFLPQTNLPKMTPVMRATTATHRARTVRQLPVCHQHPVRKVTRMKKRQERRRGRKPPNTKAKVKSIKGSSPKAKKAASIRLQTRKKTSWKLSKSKAVKTNFNTYIKEKTLKDSILEKYPVPENAGKPKTLDTFMKDMYYDSKRNFACETDKKLNKVQQKLYDVLGPLGTLWKSLSKAKSVSGEEVIQLLDQSVVLIGQANNSINFIRRLNELTSLGIDKIQATSMLKDFSEDFKPKLSNLFGKQFYKTLKRRSKVLKLSKSLIRDFRKPNHTGPSGKGASSSTRQNRGGQEDQPNRHQQRDDHNRQT